MNFRRILLQADSYFPIPSSLKRESKICLRLFTSSFKREIRPRGSPRTVTAKKCTKKFDAGAKLLFCLLNLFLFYVPALNSLIGLYFGLKVGGGGGGEDGSFVSPIFLPPPPPNPPSCFSLATGLDYGGYGSERVIIVRLLLRDVSNDSYS